jgi:dGTPase
VRSVEAGATPDRPPWNERLHGNGRSNDVRSSFAIDRDRVIHSDTFRELQHKTQVQSVRSAGAGVGFFRTRLNHVIEVAQIARGLAAEIGANPDLAEAIALAHDLGHPPFGHAGERGLSAALAEHGVPNWNANIHSLVVVDEIEAAFVSFAGLDLTWATREGIARHATPFDAPVGVGEFAESPNSGLEAQLVDAADVMAYLAHDLDDALRGDYIAEQDLNSVAPMLTEIAKIPSAAWRDSPWPPEERDLISRRRLVAKLIGRLIGDLTAATTERIAELGLEHPEQVRASPDRAVILSAEFEELTRDLLGLLVERYYRSSTVRESDAEAVDIVKGLFTVLVQDPRLVPPRFREKRLPLRVATYIASLNDLSATQLAERLGVSGIAREHAPS